MGGAILRSSAARMGKFCDEDEGEEVGGGIYIVGGIEGRGMVREVWGGMCGGDGRGRGEVGLGDKAGGR